VSGYTATNQWQRAFLVVGTLMLVIGGLYVARTVLVPVVLAVLLTFIFGPVVSWLQRRGPGRVVSVLIVTGVAFAVLGLLLFVVFMQMKSLVLALPEYRVEITQKLEQLRDVLDGAWLNEVTEALKVSPPADKVAPAEPIPVTVTPSRWSMLSMAAPAMDVLVGAGLVVILVMFMLIRREDLRNRVIRLCGEGNLTLMTKALDDAGVGISQFLLMQFIINATYGLVLGVGLFLLGVPYSVLWGFLAAVLRYLPYIGPWIGALFPLAISVAVMPGWSTPLLVLGLIAIIELLSNNFMEPVLYGQSLGISEVSLLVSAAFWAWLWGPVGLVLATPLTVCLAVLGRFVPSLGFLSVLLDDEVKLAPHATYYQRLLAKDQDEAIALVEERLAEKPASEVFDEVIVPAMALTKGKRNVEHLAETDAAFIYRVTDEWLGDLEAAREFARVTGDDRNDDEQAADAGDLVLGWATDHDADQLGVRMLRYLLAEHGIRVENLASPARFGELLAAIHAQSPSGICLVSILPGAVAAMRSLCKRLRGHCPDLKIIACICASDRAEDKRAADLKSAGADHVVTSLSQCRDQVLALSSGMQRPVPRTETRDVGTLLASRN